MDRIQPRKGFTLVELIVVIAVLAILAAIAVPSFNGLIRHSEEAVCIANRETLLRQIYTEETVLGRPLTNDEIDNIKKELSEICPNGGTILVSSDGTQRSVSCSIHTEQSVAADAAGRVIQNFETLDPSQYTWGFNSKLFKDYYDKFGKWETVQVGNNVYYAKPYYNEYTKEMVVFANTISEYKENWTANLIYHNKKWYRYINQYGNQNASISIVNYDWKTLNDRITAEGSQLVPVDIDTP